MSQTVRVRYAPSPTGLQHIGNIRTALFNWLFARHEGGRFIIRIEDTDRARSREEYVGAILDDFRWLGMDWDEGPEVDGPYGPYRQSERLEIYRKYADRLLAEGKAYPCYCTPAELEERRQSAQAVGVPPGDDVRCRELTDADRKRFQEEGRKASLRFRVPKDRAVTFDDLVLGPTSFEARILGDFIILKSDGWPTYHFGVVVDDAEMAITHVIRAEGHLSNTPLHVLLFEALGLAKPQFAHLPSVLSADGKGKLSKRYGALSLAEYRRQGYLPEAVMNFMALLGWSPGADQEFLTRAELIEKFTLDRVKKSGARFDTEKLVWMNANYIKKAPTERLVDLAREAFAAAGSDLSGVSQEWLSELVEVYRGGLKTMAELPAKTPYLFSDLVDFDQEDVDKILLKGDGLLRLRQALDSLEGLPAWEIATMEKSLGELVASQGVGFGKVAQPIRVALTGRKISPGIFETLHLLGRPRSLERMRRALEQFSQASRPQEGGE